MEIAPLSAIAPAQTVATTDAVQTAPTTPAAPGVSFAGLVDADAATRSTARTITDPDGWQQLESLLVQQMLQHVMASESGGFFGEGLGSDYYASFMAEQIAGQIAGSMDLGIAERLGGHYRDGEA